MRLTDPVTLAGRTAQSRVVFGPHETNLGRRRALSPRHAAYYQRRARGGAGVIITEVASVHPSDWPYERAPLAAGCAAGWREIAVACHRAGALVLAGLGHTGLQGSSAYAQEALWAPSRFTDPASRETPMVMERPQISDLIAGFAQAAEAAAAAGLDGAEIDAGPRALLRQFHSGLTNWRRDAYGTEPLALTAEVLAAVRAAIGDDHVLALRLSCDELAPWGGVTPREATAQAAALAPHLDLLTVVRGGPHSADAYRPDGHTPPMFNSEVTRAVRRAVGGRVPVVLQGSVVDPAAAQAALDGGVADLAEMTRAQIADADLVAKLRAGRAGRVRPCLLCNQACLVRDPRNPVVSCVTDPRSGHETEDPPDPPDPPGHAGDRAPARHEPEPWETVLIVGGGPAGLEAARVAALAGHRVRLAERGRRLAGTLHAAATPPGRERLALLAGWLESECERLGVRLSTGTEITAADLDAARARGVHVVLATGSGPAARFPAGAAAPMVDALAALAGAELPTGPAVVHDPAGGPAGVGVAEWLAAGGRRAAIVTPDQVVGAQLTMTGDLTGASARLQRAGVALHPRALLREVSGGTARLEDTVTGEQRWIGCAVLIDCGHRLPGDALYRQRPGTPRAGDCVAPRTIAEAILEGRRRATELPPPRGEGPPPGAAALPPSPGLPPSPSPAPAPRRPVPHAPPHDRAGSHGPPAPGAPDQPRSWKTRPRQPAANGYPRLFSPLPLGPLTVRNRIVFCAHLTNYAEDGLPSPQHAAYYAARAAGGAGLIITEEHSVHPTSWPYEKLIQGFRPEVIPGYRRLTGAVHAHGAVILAQLNHNGGQGSGMYSRLPLWAPSPVPDPLFREVPKAAEPHEIREIVAGYATVARHCAEGGFDGAELQCSHSSIVRCFLSRATNHRGDAYGGPLENRARLLLEIIGAVRGALGPGRVLGVRICGDEGTADGITLAEAVRLARLVAATGKIDYISTAIGMATATLHLVVPGMRVPPGYALYIPDAIRRAVPVPVTGVGRFTTPAQAERALAEGRCDLVGVVRGQIADPGFAAKAHAGRATAIRTCLACNQECVGRVGRGRWLGCVENPRAGRESAGSPRRARTRRRVYVVGGGPGGLQAAITAASRGHQVTVFERSKRPGGQVSVAAAAPGRAGFGDLVRNLAADVTRAGAGVRLGRQVSAGFLLASSPDAVVLATGARPAHPAWSRGHPRVADVREVLDGTVSPSGSVVVVDELGFHQATSTAELLAGRGCEVTVITSAMVVGQDLGITLDMEIWAMKAHAQRIGQRTEVAVLDCRTGPAGGPVLGLLHHPTGRTWQLACDWAVTALPPEPEDGLWHELAGAPFEVHRVGDCLAPRRAHAAVIEGERVGAAL